MNSLEIMTEHERWALTDWAVRMAVPTWFDRAGLVTPSDLATLPALGPEMGDRVSVAYNSLDKTLAALRPAPKALSESQVVYLWSLVLSPHSWFNPTVETVIKQRPGAAANLMGMSVECIFLLSQVFVYTQMSTHKIEWEPCFEWMAQSVITARNLGLNQTVLPARFIQELDLTEED